MEAPKMTEKAITEYYTKREALFADRTRKVEDFDCDRTVCHSCLRDYDVFYSPWEGCPRCGLTVCEGCVVKCVQNGEKGNEKCGERVCWYCFFMHIYYEHLECHNEE